MTTAVEPSAAGHPAVAGKPRMWLRTEGFVELAAALLLFGTTGQSWWLVLLILVPDLLMVGYLGGTKVGAALYNVGHSQIAPVLLALFALHWDHALVLALSLLWFAHIGMDRALAYGLKYDSHFGHTHLGDLTMKPHRKRRSDGSEARS